jgi:hypothetical protein
VSNLISHLKGGTLKVFEKRVLMGIFDSEKKEVIEVGEIKLSNEERCN